MTVFRKTCLFTYAKCKFTKDGGASGWPRDLLGVARGVGTINGGFRRSRIHIGATKIMENGRNMTHMALLALKLVQNECQRGCEFNGDPPDPPTPHEKFKMADFGPSGERPNNRIKHPVSNSRSTA